MVLAPFGALKVAFAQDNEKSVLPEKLTDVYGKTVDIAKLASEKKLFIVTLKAPGALFALSNYFGLKPG